MTSRQWLRSCGGEDGDQRGCPTLLPCRTSLPDRDPAPTHLEVDGVHTQLVCVQVAERGQHAGQVVQAAHGLGQRICHLLAMGLDLGRAGAQVEVGEVGLGGGEGCEGPGEEGRAEGDGERTA